jgi:hypothetical protein
MSEGETAKTGKKTLTIVRKVAARPRGFADQFPLRSSKSLSIPADDCRRENFVPRGHKPIASRRATLSRLSLRTESEIKVSERRSERKYGISLKKICQTHPIRFDFAQITYYSQSQQYSQNPHFDIGVVSHRWFRVRAKTALLRTLCQIG